MGDHIGEGVSFEHDAPHDAQEMGQREHVAQGLGLPKLRQLVLQCRRDQLLLAPKILVERPLTHPEQRRDVVHGDPAKPMAEEMSPFPRSSFLRQPGDGSDEPKVEPGL